MSADDRDRRDDGRPEQARPRDRTGRPLPYGTTDVPLTEDHEPSSVEAALELGEVLWREQRYFEAHECLEHVWHAAPPADLDLWQGVIQVAVAAVHLQRDNPVGARALLERAAARLAPYPDRHRGIDVAAARRYCDAAITVLDDPGGRAPALPDFPSTDEGPWFAADPSVLGPPGTHTPIVDEPTWLAAGRPRQPRSRSRDA